MSEPQRPYYNKSASDKARRAALLKEFNKSMPIGIVVNTVELVGTICGFPIKAIGHVINRDDKQS